MKRLIAFVAAAFVSSAAVPAHAATEVALVTADLNLRAGPGTDYPVVTTLPDGASVDVHGCVRGYRWCDVSWRGYRGWASASYLNFAYQGSYVSVVEYGPPIIGFSVGSYWDHYYRSKPWYGRRHYWRKKHRHYDGDRRHHKSRGHKKSRKHYDDRGRYKKRKIKRRIEHWQERSAKRRVRHDTKRKIERRRKYRVKPRNSRPERRVQRSRLRQIERRGSRWKRRAESRSRDRSRRRGSKRGNWDRRR